MTRFVAVGLRGSSVHVVNDARGSVFRPTRTISFAAVVAVFAVAASGCSDDPKAATPSTKLSEKYQHLGSSLGQSMALLKSSATTAGPAVPAALASVASVPKNLTGGVDIAVEQNGKSGDKATNIDGDSSDETVTIFVPDAPTTAGTSASLPSFAAWKGDAASEDKGLCYLAWTKGASWFVASRCGDTTGAWVCQVTSGEAACNACNAAGECAPCDLEQGTFTCAWP